MSVSDETTTVSDGILLSDAAAAKVKGLLEQEGRDDLALRVAPAARCLRRWAHARTLRSTPESHGSRRGDRRS
ncbi:hypothetical protein ACWCPL_44795, partial [Streptomyces sp. NPDC001948]